MLNRSSRRNTTKRGPSRRKRPSTAELSGDAKTFSYLTASPWQPRFRSSQQISICQTVIVVGYHITNVAIATAAQQAFQFADIDQSAQLAAVFDQYRFDSVECALEAQNSNQNITNTGKCVSVIDYDDATALPSFAAASDYTNALVSSCQSNQYRRFVPHSAVAAYTGAFGGFENVAHQWIDAASTTVQHYGFKTVASATSSVMTYDLVMKYHITLRSIR